MFHAIGVVFQKSSQTRPAGRSLVSATKKAEIPSSRSDWVYGEFKVNLGQLSETPSQNKKHREDGGGYNMPLLACTQS